MCDPRTASPPLPPGRLLLRKAGKGRGGEIETSACGIAQSGPGSLGGGLRRLVRCPSDVGAWCSLRHFEPWITSFG